jgi:hypothetical protein
MTIRLAGLALAALAPALLLSPAPARAQYRTQDVPSLAGAAGVPVNTILFADGRDGPTGGLTKFEDWAKARPLERDLLSLYPGYAEPTVTATVNGLPKQRLEKLTVYVAQARFVVPRAPEKIDLARFATLGFVERMDPAIKHKVIQASNVTPNTDPTAAYNRRPDRRWCEAGGLCIESRYQLEGKLPLGVRLANKLEDGPKKIAEFVEFQSEVRALPPDVAAGLNRLTGIEAPVSGGLEQTIVWVNQILRFGKFLAVLQPHPADPGRTVATAYMALAVKTDVLERRKEFERVPVLRNLLPAQVLMGGSSFNTGSSISAGLPAYAKNRLAAFAEALAKE